MKIVSAALAAIMALSSPLSQAGIVYQWQATNDLTPHGIRLELEFDQATVASGAFDLRLDAEGYPGTVRPDSGLLRFYYAIPVWETASGYQYLEMSYFPRQEPFQYGHGSLEIHIQFAAGGFLAGSIAANAVSPDNQFLMQSAGNTFTVLRAGVEYGQSAAGCNWIDGTVCAGATGEIKRTDIPEPSSLALVGIGVFALCRRHRRSSAFAETRTSTSLPTTDEPDRNG